MIYIREKLFDVAFQNPASLGIVLANFIRERAKPIDRPVRAFPNPARIRISDKCFLKKRIKNPINGVMQQSVANCRFMNIPRLRIIDLERLITAVLICMMKKIVVERKDIVH